MISSSRDFTEKWHRDVALELAKLLKEIGATRILFNCHQMIKNVSIAKELVAHHNHFHLDGPGSGESRPADPYTTCNSYGIYSIRSTRINKVKKTPSSPSVDYDRTAEKDSGGGLYQSSGSRSNGVVKLSQVVQ